VSAGARARTETPVDKSRQRLLDLVSDRLASGETVIAMLPFASIPKRAKGPEGKVRTGVRQSWRRYRPVVLTARRLFLFDTGRTPHPIAVLASYDVADVHFVETVPGRFRETVLVLDLPGLGPIPFETGRLERDDLMVIEQYLSGDRWRDRRP
jgi:hypothetical protein